MVEVSNMPPIIGITGKAGSGKDTLAAYFVEHHGYVKYALADPLKQELNHLFGWKPARWEDRDWKEKYMYGGKTPREWAQWLGAFARHVDEDHWIGTLMLRAFDEGNIGRLVISDVRYDNEAEAIIANNGIVLEVVRPGITPVTEHHSENGVSLELIHDSLNNHGTADELGQKAAFAAAAWYAARQIVRKTQRA